MEHFTDLYHDIDIHKKRKSRTSSCRSGRSKGVAALMRAGSGMGRSGSNGSVLSGVDSSQHGDGVYYSTSGAISK